MFFTSMVDVAMEVRIFCLLSTVVFVIGGLPCISIGEQLPIRDISDHRGKSAVICQSQNVV